MRPNTFKAALIKSGLAASVLLLASGVSYGQTTPQQVNLTAAPTTVTMPDGSLVPMWGYFCGTLAATVTSSATCAALNPNSAATTVGTVTTPATWSPVVITIPYTSTTVGTTTTNTTTLQINLLNNLSFTPGSTGASANNIPTSLMIVGQLGGGLGTVGTTCLDPVTHVQHGGTTCTASPSHASQGVTWSTVNTTAAFTPPGQGPRVQSFGTEVAATPSTSTTAAPAMLCWGNCAVGQPGLNPGTYLIESGTHPSIQGPMGLYGILVVTTAPAGTVAGSAYPGYTPPTVNGVAGVPVLPVTYNAEVPLLFGEIDPVQNNSVYAAVTTTGFAETNVWSGQPGGCGNPLTSAGAANPTYNTCYPPAVNYTPLFYTINGVGFDRNHPTNSLFAATAGTTTSTATPPVTTPVTTGITGSVLVRLVNAGSHMHLPSIVGAQTTQLNIATAATATATAVPGFALIAEDGNRLPGVPRVQSDVFMSAGKTYDVMIDVPAAGATALPIYDRELSLSGNATERDAGMLAYIGVNGAVQPSAITAAAGTPAVANADSYASLIPCTVAPCAPVVVSDPGKGVIANDVKVYGVTLMTTPAPTGGTVVLNRNGTFTFTPTAGATAGGFSYCANGSVSAAVACSSGISATVTLGGATAPGTLTVANATFTAKTATYLAVRNPGLLAGATDSAGYPLTLDPTYTPVVSAGLTLNNTDVNGGFSASATPASLTAACPSGSPTTAKCGTFTFRATSAGGGTSNVATATLVFPAGSGLVVTVLDGYDHTTTITDYRWVIEEDQTFYVDPSRANNTGGTSTSSTCTTGGTGATGCIVPTFGVNFHTSHMPFVAQGCTGTVSCEGGQKAIDPATGNHNNVVCDVGNGACRLDPTASGFIPVDPSQVVLDPTKRYYLSVLPGDAANPFTAGYTGGPDCTTTGHCGHGMGGVPIPAVSCKPNALGATICTWPTTGATCPATSATTPCVPAMTVTALTQPSPYPPGKLSVFVFEDDFPLNGEHDSSGIATTASGNDTLAPNEPGLGGFQLHLWDAFGGNGDFTGQLTYDMFNMPLTNSLDGTIDPSTNVNACPITQLGAAITGMIVTCPKYEADGVSLSPLAGQAVIAGMMPGRWGVIATPGADRIARGEEWLQTNTLDGQKAHDSFTRIGEPSFFQEFGPASFHVSIGFANPAIINSRLPGLCAGTDINLPIPTGCGNTLIGRVSGQRLSRTPDERLYSSGSHDAFAWTQCFVSVGDPDGEDFAFAKCGADGTFALSGLPDGDWRITTFDQWNDALVDGLSTPARFGSTTSKCPGPASTQASSAGAGSVCDMGDIANTQWETNLQTRTFIDDAKSGVATASETGIPFANVAVRLRDGSLENLLLTDFTGTANFNETFPLFSWYAVETDVTRYKNTGTHVVYDAGGPADGTLSTCGGPINGTGYPPCGTSTIAKYLANTAEMVSVPTNLRVPGSVYCATADCTSNSILSGPASSATPSVCTTSTTGAVTCSNVLSTGRIDNPWFGGVEGWQGFPGQFSFIEFGKAPYEAGENGGIKGHVIYASTRPFDDPMMLVQTQWEPLVPNVTINLYKEGFEADGVTPTLTLVDHTQTSSWDAWAQGFRSDGVPNMNCPGQSTADLFYFTLFNQPQYLDWYNNVMHGTATAPVALPANSQYKCYDGMHNWNQVQPAPYDGMYQFPSVTAISPTTGKPTATNCTACTTDPDSTDALRFGLPMLPAGKYVVEVVPPAGFELVKEEDKNILIGDDFIAPATNEFGSLGAIFIVPDQAQVGAMYNANNAQNSTYSFGATPNNGIVPGFVPEPTWPCVGEMRVVPDYISLYPQTLQVSPFAGATRPLCDRKEVTLSDQMGAIAKFFLYTSTHTAAKFTGGITDDYTSEFDPFSPQFGEKFAPPNLPVSIKDWTGQEISRVYADQWGQYNGMTYSTWEVNPPNPTGYAPTMMVMCMNDPGPVLDTRQTVTSVSGTTVTTVANPTLGQIVTDPAFAQGYSQFCYEIPFMPAATAYLDTPVVPTSAFAGAGYNNVDCAYPALTPAIKEVDGDGVGPWVSAAGKALKITAVGDMAVPNNAYNGPAATTAPYNQRTVVRHYGFGKTAGTVALVDAAGVSHPLTGVAWSDLQITGNVPSGVPNCAVQQQATYATGATSTQCGELVITNAPATAGGRGLQSIDTVTVTIGGKPPTHIAASDSIQAAIDAALPGDLLMVDPTCVQTTTATAATAAVPCTTAPVAGTTINDTVAAHNEMLLMWKPVRLQGVGAVSSLINANTHPAGKMDVWRRQVNCLFGLSLNGYAMTGTNSTYDPTGTYTCPTVNGGIGTNGNVWNGWSGNTLITGTTDGSTDPQVDRLPMEAVIGWDASQNGNLAELLQEPSLMGALEGAGITVLSKGVQFPAGSTNVFGAGAATAGTMPTGTLLLTQTDCASAAHPSNFLCNPSSIDGIGITNSSQGGGGIFVHAWGHNLQIANNRIYNNSGTLSGGINLGQGEYPPSYISGSTINSAPGSCDVNTLGANALIPVTVATNAQEPYCQNLYVNMHHNAVMLGSSTGDELFSATPAGAGGVTICTGSDYYKFNYNWVCGNLSSGDGGGLGHMGYSWNGDIEHNTIIFNQSLNPTIPANGGGILIAGAPDVDPPCSTLTDADCVSAPTTIGPSDGVGPNLLINANLIQGNAAEAGSGGGIAFQNVNGSDVLAFPGTPSMWHHVTVTNNIIVDNVAGWDGGGVSMLDALYLDFINNTVAENNTTATAGVLVNTLGAPLASTQNTSNNCFNVTTGTGNCGTASRPQVAGLVTVQNSAVLSANIGILPNLIGTGIPANTKIICPAGHYRGTTAASADNGTCMNYSYPQLGNNIFWQNAAFQAGVGALSPQYQQAVVTLYNAAFGGTQGTTHGSKIATQATTGACVAGSSYWDIGVRGDTGPGNHSGGITLNPTWSVLTSTAGYGTGNNFTTAPPFTAHYCDGARQPPESGVSGWDVPPGISDATVPNPIFNLTPVATVDEGNNWINLRWGPLTMVNPLTGAVLGNYVPTTGSNNIPATQLHPAGDFFGNLRPEPPESPIGGHIDVGAVEIGSTIAAKLGANVSGGPLAFGTVSATKTSSPMTLTLHNTGNVDLTNIVVSFTGPFSRATGGGGGGGTCAGNLTANGNFTASCTINVVFVAPAAGGAQVGTATITANQGTAAIINDSPVGLSGTSLVPATLTPATNAYGTVARRSTTGPTAIFTLTNTGTATLTGIGNGVLGGTNPNEFFIVRNASTCGPAGGGQVTATTSLAVGATCQVSVQFRPVGNSTGAKSATLSVTDSGGTQSTTANGLTGTAN
jgi:Bacterial Ig domain